LELGKIMLICIVNSEEAYLDLIADLSKYGTHCRNQFAEPDEHGMSVCDTFRRLSPQTAEEYLGVRDYVWEVTTEVDEKGNQWESEPVCGVGPLNRETLHICPELKKYVVTPEQEDYPVLIMWDWGDDFDRMGSIKTRYFDWISMNSIPVSREGEDSHIKKVADLWNKNHLESYREWCRLAKERDKLRKEGG
jgi:hypothetical protein